MSVAVYHAGVPNAWKRNIKLEGMDTVKDGWQGEPSLQFFKQAAEIIMVRHEGSYNNNLSDQM